MNCANPEKLSDKDWAERIQELHYIRESEKNANK